MDLAILVYAISLLHGLGVFGVGLIILSAVTIVVNAIYWVDNNHSEKTVTGIRSRCWKAFWVATCAAVFLIFLPTEKTAYTMVGAYAAQKVAENDKVQAMSGKVLTIIEQKLDNYIEDGIKEAEDKAKKVNGKDKSR